eukprot:1881480-Pyramimonas_sp.AAC.1
MGRSRKLSVQHAHLLAQVNRVEHSCQTEQRLLTGREMIRDICVWCSVRPESGWHWMCRDLQDYNRPPKAQSGFI